MDSEVRLRESLNSAVESGLYLREGGDFYGAVEQHYQDLIRPAIHLERFVADCQEWQRCRSEALQHRQLGDEMGATMLEAEQSGAYCRVRQQLNSAGPLPLPLLRLMDECADDPQDTAAIADYLSGAGYDVC